MVATRLRTLRLGEAQLSSKTVKWGSQCRESTVFALAQSGDARP